MSQKNRANMLTDIINNIYNNLVNFITGQNAQDRFVNLLDSAPNILSDKDQSNGYVGTSAANEMLSAYYCQSITGANLFTLSDTAVLIPNKWYLVTDANTGANKVLVQAETINSLYGGGYNSVNGDSGTYDVNTGSFVAISGSGNASIVAITSASLIALGGGSSISTTTLYIITDAAAGRILTKGLTTSTIEAGVVNLTTGESGTYVLATDTFTVTVQNLQQVTGAGNTTTNEIISSDGALAKTKIGNGYINISTGASEVTIDAALATMDYTALLPDKAAGTETFAMLSDIVGGGDVVGPASAVNNNVVLFDGVTGKLIKDSGVGLASKQDTLISATNIKTINGASILGAGNLVVTSIDTVIVQCFALVLTTVADSTNYHFGILGAAPSGTDARRSFKFTDAGTIEEVSFNLEQVTNGSAETVNIYLRNVTTATDTLIGTFTSNFGASTTYKVLFIALAIAINTTDDYTIKITTPPFATNPTSWIPSAMLSITKS